MLMEHVAGDGLLVRCMPCPGGILAWRAIRQRDGFWLWVEMAPGAVYSWRRRQFLELYCELRENILGALFWRASEPKDCRMYGKGMGCRTVLISWTDGRQEYKR